MLQIASLLSLIASLMTFVGIRRFAGWPRRGLLTGALAVFVLSSIMAKQPYGYWTGFYVMLSVFFLGCITLPWVVFWWKERRAA